MKLIAELGPGSGHSEKYEIEIKRDGEKVFARVDDREYELEAAEVEPDVFLLTRDHQVYQVYVAPDGTAHVGGRQFDVRITDPKRLRGAGPDAAADAGAAEIKTAMPGKVVRVLAAPGSEVKAGDGVIVVEAMKMQNEMKAPKDGTIKEIRFGEGATVNAGDILVIIE